MAVYLRAFLVVVFLLPGVGRMASAEDQPLRRAVVARGVENLYSRPSAEADVVTQAIVGQNVSILSREGDFSQIETPDRYRGWIASSALIEYTDSSQAEYARQGNVVQVKSLLAFVYRQPDVTASRPVVQVTLGARLEVESESAGKWLRVRLPSGEQGFVQAGDVDVYQRGQLPRDKRGEAVVATARRLLGLPYLWGGTTPLGVDCSGLVGLSYRVHDVVLPRDAHLQFDDESMEKVDRDMLQAGDLVFFGRNRISHVGLYAGDGVFVHATTHGTPTVQENRLDEPHWQQLYRGARRPPEGR